MLSLIPFHLNQPGTADLPAWYLTRLCVGGQKGAEGQLGGSVWADGGAAGNRDRRVWAGGRGLLQKAGAHMELQGAEDHGLKGDHKEAWVAWPRRPVLSRASTSVLP